MVVNSCPPSDRLSPTCQSQSVGSGKSTPSVQKSLPTALVTLSRAHNSGTPTGKPRTQGFTLIEALLAIVIVAITMASITPLMFAVVATRVQQRKAEQATQLAQAEIDRIRTTVERGIYTAADLPATVGTSLGTNPNLSNLPTTISSSTKSTSTSCNSYNGGTIAATTLLPVDTNGDCQSDFLVQSFRTTGQTGSTVPTTGFRMVVRVYADTSTLRQRLGSLSNANRASLTFTTGNGQVYQPLAVLTSTIVRNDTSGSLQNYGSICTTPGGC